MPVGQGARNNIILGGLGRPNLFDTNVKATSIDEDIFTDQEVITAAADGDLVLVLDVSETPDKIKYITKSNFIGEGLVAITGNVNNRIISATGSALVGEANLLFDGTILTNDGGEVNIDISGGDPHLSFQIAGTDKFTIGVDDDDSDILKIDTGGTTGGATKVSLDSSGNMTLAGALTVTGNILPAADDTHDIGSASAAFQDLFLEGDITLTDAGTIATSAGDLTVDAEGDIILDANGANVTFKDNGTSILDIVNSSTDVEITVSTADKNLKFKGTDGSSAITALDIDMAAAGAATFNSDVVVGGLLKMPSNTASKILVADGSSFEEVAVGDLSEISSIANDDVFIAIDTTDGVLKKVSRSQVVSGLAASGAISDVVDDSSPQLGGDLDVNGNGLVSTSSGNIALTPNGTGVVRIDGSNGIDMESGAISIKNSGAESYVRFYCESSNAHYTQLQAAPHSAYAGNVTVVLPATADTLVGRATTDTLTNKTLTSPVINTGTFGTSILPVSADGTTLGSATKEFSDLFLADGGQILFGDDQEITLTHVADDGLVLKHVGTADGKEPSFSFHAGDNDIAANDVLGSIFFKAPDEGAGTDAILVAAGIEAVSEGDFSASNNATKLSFLTGASEAAAEKMSLSSAGLLTIADDFMIKDGGTIGVASTNDAITISSAGIVTFKDDIVIKDGGTIGVSSAADAMTISSAGIVTFKDDIIIKDAGTIGSASDTDAISISSGGVVNISATTANTGTGDGALTVAGGMGVAADVSIGDDLRLISDSAILSFGANSEITLTHVHDVGLALKHSATADDKPIVLTLQTGETDIAANDVIGAINFQAPDEGTGTDAILVAAGIEAVSEGDFAADNNATKLSFKTGASEAAAEKMSLSSGGNLVVSGNVSVGGDLDVTGTFDLSDSNFTNAGSIQLDSIAGDADTNTSITFSGSDVITIATGGSTAATFNSSQVLTLSAGLLIPDGGNIGSASDTNAIGISSGGVVSITATTANTDASDGALTVAGGASVAADVSIGDDLRLISDSSVLSFGANSEITLSHVHDEGLALKHTATADDKPIILTLQTGETDIAANDVLGAIRFQAPDEGTGTDAILTAAAIQAVSEGDFAADANATRLEFHTGASEAAAVKMTLSSAGVLDVDGGITIDNLIMDGTTIGHADDTDLMTLADGLLTVAGEISVTTLDIGGTNVGSTAGELNLLDGSAKSTSSITIADADAFIVIDGSTTKQIPASDIKTYAAGSSATKGFATAMAIAL